MVLPGPSKTEGSFISFQKAGNAVVDELLVETAPPVARAGAREIGKDRRAGPDDTYELAAIGILYEVVPRRTGVIRGVTFTGGMSDVQIGNCDQMQMLFAEIGHESREVWEGLWIDSEGPILVLV